MKRLNDIDNINPEVVFLIVVVKLYGQLSIFDIMKSLSTLHSDDNPSLDSVGHQCVAVLNTLDTDKKLKEYLEKRKKSLLGDEVGSSYHDPRKQALTSIRYGLSLAEMTEQVRNPYLEFIRREVVIAPEGYIEWEDDVLGWAESHIDAGPTLLLDG